MNRRSFLNATPAVLAASLVASPAAAQVRPAISKPRATAGDVIEPKWDTRLAITVGAEKADLVGTSEKAIQAAIDYMAARGGGTVRILPGTYLLRNAVSMRSGVRLIGSGLDSILMKAPQVRTTLSEDSQYWDQEVTLADPSGFEVGDGVCLQVNDVRHRGHYIIRRTLIARSGSRFKLDRPLQDDDFTRRGRASITTLFPLLSGEGISEAVVENMALDGNKAAHETLDHYWGNLLAGAWFDRSNHLTLRKLTSRNSCADGLAWGTSHDVSIEDCHCHDNVGFGLHPGSGSQRSVARRNRLERNFIGVYFCQGAKYGLVENNVILESGTSGISIGQNDTDNLIRGNTIRGSGVAGVLFRGLERDLAPHHNELERNHIVDNGDDDGIGIDIQGEAGSIVVSRNEVKENRQPLKRIGVRIGARSGEVQLVENNIQGFSAGVQDLRRG